MKYKNKKINCEQTKLKIAMKVLIFGLILFVLLNARTGSATPNPKENNRVVPGKDYPAAFFAIQSGGVILNTRSIQYGIDYISQNGGGRLVFPSGKYLTGCIHFKSDVIIPIR